VAPGVLRRALPADLQDRRVEITGPSTADSSRANSGASVFMGACEDTTAPRVLQRPREGQANLRTPLRGTIGTHRSPNRQR